MGVKELNERNRQRRLETCVHFTGLPLPGSRVNEPTCDAGIAYRTVKDHSIVPYRWPCLHPAATTTCVKREYPTEADIDAEDAARFEYCKLINTARAACVETGLKEGSVKCPKCGGILRFTIASNGHVWGHCETENCLAWME